MCILTPYIPLFFLALGLAYTRNNNVAFGLFAVSGLVLLAGPAETPLAMARALLEVVSTPAVASTFGLVALYNCFVGSVENGGAIAAMTKLAAKHAKSPVSVQLCTWLSCTVAFFSDFGSTMIIGSIYQPLYDEYRVPREKLALALSLLGGPLASLFPLWIWGIYFASVLQDTAAWQFIPGNAGGFSLMLRALPYAFFPILCFLCIPVTAFLGDLSLMRAAWRRTGGGTLYDLDSGGLGPLEKPSRMAEASETPLTYLLAVGGVVVTYLIVSGGVGVHAMTYEETVLALSAGYVTGAIILFTVPVLARKKTLTQCYDVYSLGFRRVLSVTVPITLAVLYARIGMGTGLFASMASLYSGLPRFVLPISAFALACGLSWLTGSSWGTFAVLAAPFLAVGQEYESLIPMIVGAIVSGSLVSPVSHTVTLVSRGAWTTTEAYRATTGQYVRLMAAISAVLYLALSFFV